MAENGEDFGPGGGDQIETGSIEGEGIAIGRNARVEINRYIKYILPEAALEDLPPKPGEPPYKGLAYFTEKDADIYFGREELSDDLAARIEMTRFLAVVGASGSGKSSLLRAGVVPWLRQKNWQIHIISPTADPLRQLANSLTKDDKALDAADRMREQLLAEPQTLRRAAEKLSARNNAAQFLLIVDQFEELFTQNPKEKEKEGRASKEYRAFLENLLVAASSTAGVHILIGLRADFTGHLAEPEELRTLVQEQFVLLGPMRQEDLVRVIMEPARVGGWAFVDGLVEQILKDVGREPGRLPLLSHALLETWKRRSAHVMTLKGYQEAGSVDGAIAKTAEDTLRQLGDEEKQAIMQAIFLELTELGEGAEDTRRIAHRDELARIGDETEVNAVLEALVTARLVTVDNESVEVAHEALIRRWPKLREWLADNRERLRFERQVEHDAQIWKDLNRDEGPLYRGPQLARAAELMDGGEVKLSESAVGFLTASRELAARVKHDRELQRQREVKNAQRLAAEAQMREAAEIEARNAAESQRAVEEKARQQAEADAAILRKRAIYLVGILAFAIASALAAFFFFQDAKGKAREAVNNLEQAKTSEAAAVEARATAEAESVFARSQTLAVASQSWLESDTMKALLLALQAGKLANTPSTIQSLNQSILKLPEPLITIDTGPIRKLQWLGNGKYFLVVSEDGNAQIWDAQKREIFLNIEAETWEKIDASKEFGMTEVDSNGATALTASGDTVSIWNLREGVIVQEFSQNCDVWDVSWNVDESRILTKCTNGPSRVWNAADGALLFELKEGVAERWCADGSCILGYESSETRTDSGEVTAYRWDSQTGKLESTNQVTDEIFLRLFWKEDGTRIMTTGEETAKVWDTANDQLMFTLPLDPRGTQYPQWNADGSRILTLDSDGHLDVWDANSGTLVFSVPSADQIWKADWSIDGAKILILSGEENRDTAQVVSTNDGSNLITFLIDDTEGFTDKAWNSEGTQLLATDRDGKLQLWDFTRGLSFSSANSDTVRYDVEGIDVWGWRVGGGTGFDWSEEEDRAAVIARDGVVQVWDVPAGKITQSIQIGESLRYLDMNSNGTRLITSGAASQPKIWNTEDGSLVCTLPWFPYEDSGAKWSHGGSHLVTPTKKDTWEIWDGANCEQKLVLNGVTFTSDVNWSTHGEVILVNLNNGTSYVWIAGVGELLPVNPSGLFGLSDLEWSPDGKQFAVRDSDNTVKIWDTVGGKLSFTLSQESPVIGSAYWSADGTRIVTRSETAAHIWHSSDGTLVHSFSHPFTTIGNTTKHEATWNNEGNRFLTQNYGGLMQLWDDHNNLLFSQEQATHAHWNENMTRILAVGEDGKARVLDVGTGTPILEISHKVRITGARWIMDDRYIATEHYDLESDPSDWRIRVWDNVNGNLLYSIPVLNLADLEVLKGKNRIIVNRYKELSVWDAEDGQLLIAVSDSGPINKTEIIADDSSMLVVGDDWARIYDLEHGDMLMTFAELESGISSTAWNEVQRQLTVITDSGFIWQYTIRADITELTNAACRIATRNLTWTEWQTYFPGQPYQQTCHELPPHSTVCTADPTVEGCLVQEGG